MKHIIYYFIFSLLFVLSSCAADEDTELSSQTKAPGTGVGGTEEDAAKVAELENILCASPGGWVMSYEGEDFYFQFREDGTVDSDSKLLYSMSTSIYRAKTRNGQLSLNISDGGHLAYLSEALRETTFVISAFTSTKVTCVGANKGKDMSLTPIAEGVVEGVQQSKAMLVAMQTKNLLFGVIRDSNDKFKAHYVLDHENRKVRFVYLDNRLAKNMELDMTIEGTQFNWADFTLDGATIDGIEYNGATNSITLTGSSVNGFKLTPNHETLAYFDNRERQFQFSKTKNIGDAKDDLFEQTTWEYLAVVEINCTQGKRPLVAVITPAGGEGYIFYDVCASDGDPIVKDEKDRVYFINPSGGSMPFGGNPQRLKEANESKMNKILAAWFHQDGLYLIKEVDNGTDYLYFISPTTENWFKAKKTR